MANQASIQAHINFGYSKVAQYLGALYTVYRPKDINDAISQTNSRGTIMAHFDSSFDFGAARPQVFAKPLWACAVDRTNMRIGDYLLGPIGTFFIFAVKPLLPTAAVGCNSAVTIYRPGADQTIGNGYYGGNPGGYGTKLVGEWPASVLMGTKGEQSQSGVMGDTRLQWMSILLPQTLTADIQANDLIIDNVGRRITISAVELTDGGYHLSGQYSGS